MAFSPDGKLLATADNDGTVRLWNTATSQPTGAPLSVEPGGGVNGVAFSPDDKLLATVDSNENVRLWETSLFVNPYQVLCTDAGPLTEDVWDQYARGEEFPSACPA